MSDRFTVHDADPNFAYRWVNQAARVVDQRIHDEGWEVVEERELKELTPATLAALGQSSPNPGGGSIRRRGDVILMRMPRERYEKVIRGPKEAVRERQMVSTDAMVREANDHARRLAKQHGLGRIPKDLAFASSPDRDDLRKGKIDELQTQGEVQKADKGD